MKKRHLSIPLIAMALLAFFSLPDVLASEVEVLEERPTTDILACTDPNGELAGWGIDAEESPSNHRHAMGQTFSPSADWEVDKIGIQFATGSKEFSAGGAGGKIKLILFEYDEALFRSEQWGTFSNPLKDQGTLPLYEEVFDYAGSKRGDWLVLGLGKKPLLAKGQTYGFAIWISSASAEATNGNIVLYRGEDSHPDGSQLIIRSRDAEGIPGNRVAKRSSMNFFIQGRIR